MERFLKVIADNRAGKMRGIYAICTAHPLVLEAALQQGLLDGTPILIEATANQVNQFGGYTGMQPSDFVPFIDAMADRVGFPRENIILGGDHLGPVCWCNETAEQAMKKSSDLVAAYVAAGFNKIHLDTSIACADDPELLSDVVVAARAAKLCEIAELTAYTTFGKSELAYVVGTEVPVPGGAINLSDGLQVTSVAAVRQTVEAHKKVFLERGLDVVWSRVIGLVVQPGVEFDHTSVHDYAPEEAASLSAMITDIPNLVFEAHSTDYQPSTAYPRLVRDHFAILKVGPQLTYALREALFALSHIEDELLQDDHSNLRSVCEDIMLKEPQYWQNYYPNVEPLGRLYRRYSYSDRIRCYWNKPAISAAVERLINNLSAIEIPLPLLDQYMPSQYLSVRAGTLSANPQQLIRHHIMRVTACYANACWNNT